ncbi:MAG: DUF2281 domain-containing protein [Bacteroidota bacterium]
MSAIQLYSRILKLPAEMRKQVADYIESLLLQDPPKQKKKDRIPGLAKGMIMMKDNFDDPIDDFHDYM